MLIRSFQAEFPYTSIWYKHTSDFCSIIGTPKPLKIDFQGLERRVNRPEMREHLARSNVVDVYDFLDSFCFADDTVERAVGEGPLQTDDRPYLEFHCNRPMSPGVPDENILFLAEPRERVWPRLANVPTERAARVEKRLERWFEGTQHLIQAQYAARILRCYEASRDVLPDYDNYVDYMRAEFEQARRINPEDKNAAVLWQHNLAAQEIRTANSYAMRGQRLEALEHYARAIRLAPDSYIRAGARHLYEQAAAGPPR